MPVPPVHQALLAVATLACSCKRGCPVSVKWVLKCLGVVWLGVVSQQQHIPAAGGGGWADPGQARSYQVGLGLVHGACL